MTPNPKTLKAEMTERREWRKIPRNPKRRNDGKNHPISARELGKGKNGTGL